MNQRQIPTGEDGSVCQSVVEAVARAEGVAPEALDTSLYEAIDPDALEQIFAPTSATGRRAGWVRFTYHGHEVIVSGDGRVSIDTRPG